MELSANVKQSVLRSRRKVFRKCEPKYYRISLRTLNLIIGHLN